MGYNDANNLSQWLLGQVGSVGAGLALVYASTTAPGDWVNDGGGFNFLEPTLTVPGEALVVGAIVEVVAVVTFESTGYPTPTIVVDVFGGPSIIAGATSKGAQTQASRAYLRGEAVITEAGFGIGGAGFGWLGVPSQFAVDNFTTAAEVAAQPAGDDVDVRVRWGLSVADPNVRARVEYMRVTVTPPATPAPAP